MKKKVRKLGLAGIIAVCLNSCTTSGIVDRLTGGIVNNLFEKKEDTTDVMTEAVKRSFFSSGEGQYEITLDLSSLSRDGDICLANGDYYLAFKAYSYAGNIYGMEAAAQVARDKNCFKDFVAISQGLEDNENFEYNPFRGYIYAVEKGYEFKKPANFFFSTKKKAVDSQIELEEEK